MDLQPSQSSGGIGQMKSKLSDDQNAFLGTINLELTIAILVGLLLGGYYIYNLISGDSSSSDGGLGERLGDSIWGFLSGATSGFFGGAWKTGTDIGKRWNPVTTWRNSSRRSDGKWWTFW